MAYRSYNILKIYTYFVAMVVVGVGCAHNRDVKQAEGQERPTHYTLRLGEAAVHNEPLPSYTPIMIDWHYSSGRVQSVLGFKAWDFNGDGRFDMVQSASSDSPGQAVFDFDFDGTIDFRKENL